MEISSDLTYKYYRRSGSEDVCLILHGASEGIESPFISQLWTALAENERSVLAFNLPYRDRGEDATSANLAEEVAALGSVVTGLRAEGYQTIRVIAKSLGAIITSFYLEATAAREIKVAVLGYVIGEVKTVALAPQLELVIQGGRDRFGDAAAVRDEIGACPAKIVEIAGADHSYRNADREPEYQPEAIRSLVEKLTGGR